MKFVKKIFDVLGLTVSVSAICRLLRSYGITRKKVRMVALQQSAALQGAFMAHCYMFSIDKFVWVDKTGSDRRDQLCKYGYSLREVIEQYNTSFLFEERGSVHHVEEVIDLFHDTGILVLFLPPYNPNLNPIEMCFSYIKSYLKKHNELLEVIPDSTCVIKSAFDSVNEEHCRAWIHNSGYIIHTI